MKHQFTLAENMRRFGTKNLAEQDLPNNPFTKPDVPSNSNTDKGRIRLNNPRVDHIVTNIPIQVHLIVTINDDGLVIDASSTPKTTTTDQRIIDQVIDAVKRQVRYVKIPGAELISKNLRVDIPATVEKPNVSKDKNRARWSQ